MLSIDDIQGVWAITPTPAKAGSDRLDARDTVDLDELERLTERLISDGVDGLIVFGTTGECATCTPEEWRAASACVAQTVRNRVPLLIGATAMGGHEIAERLRYVRDLGADGSMLGLPMWQPCTLPMAVQFYADVAELFPDLALMVYANPNAFRFGFPPPFWAQVARRAPTVIAAKHGGDLMINTLLKITGGSIRFLPHVANAFAQTRINPEHNRAFWATEAAMGPAPAIALRDAMAAGDWENASRIDSEINWSLETFFPPGGLAEFASFNLQLEKIRFNAAGYCNAGPIRPPYQVMPEGYTERAQECGHRWAELQRRYGNET